MTLILNMTIVVDWDVNPQKETKKKKKAKPQN